VGNRAHAGLERKRLRTLVFAYACDPEAGSEPAAGWAIARAIARFADAVVLTGPEHDAALRSWKAAHPSDSVTFAVVPEPRWARLIPRTRTGRFLIYLGWLANARAAARRLDPSSFDLAWHATYAVYWLPSPVASLGLPSVWGPVGGGVTTPWRLWPVLGVAGMLSDLWERTVVRMMALLPQTRRTWHQATVAIAQNEETLARLPMAVQRRAVVLNHALLVERPAVPEQPRERVVVFAASLEPRKAPSLVIRALSQTDPAVRLLVMGDGPERGSLERLADRLGVRSRVTFAGHVSRQELLRALSAAAAAVFTGVREEGGIALVEAMVAGTPTIVVAHGGARTIVDAATDRDRVVRISPESVDRTVRALADAMSRLVLKPCLARDPLLDAQRASAQLEEIASQVARHNWGTTPPPGPSRRALAVP